LHATRRAAHHRTDAEPDIPRGRRLRENAVETGVGIVLIVISALEIVFLIRVVQSNMAR
jgi:hypothetical protein